MSTKVAKRFLDLQAGVDHEEETDEEEEVEMEEEGENEERGAGVGGQGGETWREREGK